MTEYHKLLLSDAWQSKRSEIISRDKDTCQHCLNLTLYNKSVYGRIIREVRRSSGYLTISTAPLFSESTPSFYIPDNVIPKMAHLRDYKILISRLSNETPHQVFAIRKFKDVDIDLMLLLDKLSKIESEKFAVDKQIKIFIEENRTSFFSGWKVFAGLHVHHKYYQLNKLPWEYPGDALTTLCWHCHTELHQNGTVPMLDEVGNEIKVLHFCKKCHGAGKFPEYSHVENGICFRCSGARYEELRGAYGI